MASTAGSDPAQPPAGSRWDDDAIERLLARLLQAGVLLSTVLVVVETLNGRRITWSIASTLSAPEPMPSSPESTPAASITAKPVGTACTEYGWSPCGVG